jgi:hypothetical protein
MNMKVAGHRETRRAPTDQAAFGRMRSNPFVVLTIKPQVLRPASLIQTYSIAPANWFARLKHKIVFFVSVKHCPFPMSNKTCPSNFEWRWVES